MSRVVIISIIILAVVTWLGIKAKQAGHKTVSIALFTAAGIYAFILIAGFFGWIGEY